MESVSKIYYSLYGITRVLQFQETNKRVYIFVSRSPLPISRLNIYLCVQLRVSFLLGNVVEIFEKLNYFLHVFLIHVTCMR